MDTIFMTSFKTCNPHRLLLSVSDKINLNKSKFKIPALKWNKEFELPGGSYSVSDIQDLSKCIFKKHETVTDNPSIRPYINKIEDRITFKTKTGYYLELLTTEIRRTKIKITKDKNSENVPHLEIAEVVLIYCNIVNDYQQDSSVLYIFVPNKSFSQLLDISPQKNIFLKTFNSNFSYVEIWFTDHNSKLLQIEDKINFTLVID